MGGAGIFNVESGAWLMNTVAVDGFLVIAI
jgi:hypothetical protein